MSSSSITDARLVSRVVSRAPLLFSGGADSRADRPAHVRAASGLARIPQGLIVVQDDSNFLGLIDPLRPALAHAIPLPPGADGLRQFGDSRANKHLKLDLEACVALDDPHSMVICFGSGSTPARESIVAVTGIGSGEPLVRVVDASRFYAALRRATGFAGSEMNVEGAVQVGESLRFFGRGNGATSRSRLPLNATCDVALREMLAYLEAPDDAAPPQPSSIRQFSLGALDGVPLGFTDAAEWNGEVLFAAAAERSPDAVRDGPVSGSVIGIAGIEGRVRWAAVVDEEGRLLREKVEGLAVATAAELAIVAVSGSSDRAAPDASGGTAQLWVVADADDETRPAELLRIRLEGPWRERA